MSKSLSKSDPVIAARGLVKRFGSVTALDGLDLSVERGTVHGFLGPNGAGKSTTIRAILGQLRLDEGQIEVLGHDAWHEAVAAHRSLAYVPGDTNLWPGLTGGECIDVLGAFQGQQDRVRRDQLIERFDLDPTRKARTYSKGNRQKVALIAALATTADLLLLDEPTSGLDPLMEAVFQQCILEAREQGSTVLLSSHILAEVEALCDRVSIVRHGCIVSEGSLDELRHQTLTGVDTLVPQAIPELATLAGVSRLTERAEAEGVHLAFRVDAEHLAAATALVAAAAPRRLTVAPPSLDELFLTHYQEEQC